MKLIILIGLPASGKTSWAKEYESKNSNSKHLELDKCCILYPKYFTLDDAIKGEVLENVEYGTIILDFIFYTNEAIITAINSCINFDVKQVELHYWKVDKIQCLANDKIRMEREKRKNSCAYTIMNRPLEEPKLESFANKFKNIEFNILEHEVFKPLERM